MKASRICCLALLCCATAPAHADTRVALVIGNGAYQHVDALTNPRLDARAMKAALERLGFTVVYGEDLDQKHLGQKIAEFAGEAQDADVALTYYAGHGSTFGDTSYLVPVDAEFKSLAAVTYELVPLEQMLGELRRAKGIRIAIIDACRDNGKERELKRVAQRGGAVSRGLARVQAPDGLILAFSTQYGMTAADGAPNTNSPFTAALVRQLPTPGLDVRDVFFKAGRDVLLSTNNTQRPAIEVSLYEPYALVPAPPAGVLSSVSPAPAPAQPAAQMAALPPVVPAPVVTPPPATNPRRQELIAACDRDAAGLGDPDLPAGIAGIRLREINVNAAILACRAAIETIRPEISASSLSTRLSTTGADQVAVEERRMRYQLGRALYAGKQYFEVKTQFEQAAILGSAAAMNGLGALYDRGDGVAQDYAAARGWYEKAAEKGHVTAMYDLGLLYENGQATKQDYVIAGRWYDKAAQSGHSTAMYRLGLLYEDVNKITVDYGKAIMWYEKAAAKGEAAAMTRLGSFYEAGQGVTRDYDKARIWYEKASERGEPSAMYNLGDLYANGHGVAQDYATARSWYEKSAAAGDQGAPARLAELTAKERTAARAATKSRTQR